MSEDLNGRILQKENDLFIPRLEDRLTDETFVTKKNPERKQYVRGCFRN